MGVHCTTCAGAAWIEGPHATKVNLLGLSHELRARGYGLLCVARATEPPVQVETRTKTRSTSFSSSLFFGRRWGKVRPGLPI